MQNTVEKSYKFNKFRLSDIWASIKRPTAPSHICYFALQFYILVIFNSTLWPSQHQDRKGCTQQLLWLCSGSDQSRTLILVWDVSFNPIYLCYSRPVWSNKKREIISPAINSEPGWQQAWRKCLFLFVFFLALFFVPGFGNRHLRMKKVILFL